MIVSNLCLFLQLMPAPRWKLTVEVRSRETDELGAPNDTRKQTLLALLDTYMPVNKSAPLAEHLPAFSSLHYLLTKTDTTDQEEEMIERTLVSFVRHLNSGRPDRDVAVMTANDFLNIAKHRIEIQLASRVSSPGSQYSHDHVQSENWKMITTDDSATPGYAPSNISQSQVSRQQGSWNANPKSDHIGTSNNCFSSSKPTISQATKNSCCVGGNCGPSNQKKTETKIPSTNTVESNKKKHEVSFTELLEDGGITQNDLENDDYTVSMMMSSFMDSTLTLSPSVPGHYGPTDSVNSIALNLTPAQIAAILQSDASSNYRGL